METRKLRILAAAMSLVAAAVYFLLAAKLVYVQQADSPTLKNGDITPIMLAAGAAFVFGAVLLVLFDKRVVYVPGAILQVIVLVGYVMAAPERIPSYEFWGLLCKAAQVVVLVTLVYLTVRPRAVPSMRGVRPAPMASASEVQ
jgi:hypothetical protein